MRFIALLLGLVATILVMSGCVQKLPTPSTTEGLLVIPMKASNTSRAREFLRYYEFLNSSDPTLSLQIHVGLADFWISPLLPQGNYVFDTLLFKSTNQNGIINSEKKREIHLDKPMSFSIKAGEITLVPDVLEVNQYMDNSELVVFQQRFRHLSDLERNEYIDKLISLENGGAWRLPKLR